MKLDFYSKLENCSAHRKDREANRNYALRNSEYYSFIVSTALEIKNKHHHKACWVLELICEKKLRTFVPYLDSFIASIFDFTNDSAIRAAAKICLFLSKSNHRANGISLSHFQESQIIERCIDWLISDEKVAAKVYAIKTLHILGKKHPWVHEELKTIIEQDYALHSAAYQAATRNILKKIKK